MFSKSGSAKMQVENVPQPQPTIAEGEEKNTSQMKDERENSKKEKLKDDHPLKELRCVFIYAGTARVMEKYDWVSATSPPSPICCRRTVHGHLPRHIDSQIPAAQPIAGTIDIGHYLLIPQSSYFNILAHFFPRIIFWICGSRKYSNGGMWKSRYKC